MLELRPNCECCDKDLPPAATDAMICTFECTFCRDCVEGKLGGRCPNCGGNFTSRPIRPQRNWKGGNYLGDYPPSKTVKHRPVDLAVHQRFAAAIKEIPPEKR